MNSKQIMLNHLEMLSGHAKKANRASELRSLTLSMRDVYLAISDPAFSNPEDKFSPCHNCKKEWHTSSAKYCGNCGEELEEAPAGSL